MSDEELPEKCKRCYYFTPIGCWGHCTWGKLRYPEEARDCKDFLPIDEELYEELIKQDIPRNWLVRKGKFYVWNMKEAEKEFEWLRKWRKNQE